MLLAGGCVSPASADAFCGNGARHIAGACAFVECTAPYVLDLATGVCAPPSRIRAAARAAHLHVSPAETLVCSGDAPLVLDGTRAGCVPPASLCPRGTRATPGGGCEREPACLAGEVFDRASGVCVSLLGPSTKDDYLVDVGRWLARYVGPNGGPGSSELCRPLALHAGAVTRATPASAVVQVTVEIVVPDNDVTQARASIAVSDGTGSRVQAAEALLADGETLLAGLRALGGESSAASARSVVTCSVMVESPQVTRLREDDPADDETPP